MQTVLTPEQLKEWAWSWAQRLNEQIALTPDWFSEISQMSKGLFDEAAMQYQTALSWSTAAYFEFIKSRWTQKRAQQQIAEAEQILKSLGGNKID